MALLLVPNGAYATFSFSAITEFPLPTHPSVPRGITAGPDGNVWFTEELAGIGRITPAGQITEFPFPSESYPGAITAGPDGNLWFALGHPARIGRITPAGQVTEFPLSNTNSRPTAITAGPDGNLWFTQATPTTANGTPTIEGPWGVIGRITPAGQITEFPLPQQQHVGPYGITAGPDGNLWFTEFNQWATSPQEPKIGRITTNGQITEFALPPDTYGLSVTGGPDGNLWFTATVGQWAKFGFDSKRREIGRMTTDGQFSEFRVSAQTELDGITAGPDGNLWFAGNTDLIGRITTAGRMIEFAAPPGSNPYGITAGPDGNLWFTDSRDNGAVGRVATSLVAVRLKRRHVYVHRRWVKLTVACVGGTVGSVCQGRLHIAFKVKRGTHGGRFKTIVLAHRKYSLAAENERQIALRLTNRALQLLACRRHLQTEAAATSLDGQRANRQVVLRVRSQHKRNCHHARGS